MQHSSHSLDCDPLFTHPPLPLSPLCTLHFPSLHYVPSTLPLSPLCTLHSSPLSIMYPPLFPSLHYVPSTLPLSPLRTLHSSPLSIMYPPLFPSLHYVPSTLPLSPFVFLCVHVNAFSSMVGDTLRASTLGQPPNHDQRLGLGYRDQWVTSVTHWSL